MVMRCCCCTVVVYSLVLLSFSERTIVHRSQLLQPSRGRLPREDRSDREQLLLALLKAGSCSPPTARYTLRLQQHAFAATTTDSPLRLSSPNKQPSQLEQASNSR